MNSNQFDFEKYVEHSELADKSKKAIKADRSLNGHYRLFFSIFGLVFLVSLLILSILGLTPKEISLSPEDRLNNSLSLESQSNSSLFGVDFTKGGVSKGVQKISSISSDDLPNRIMVSSIGLDSNILNPESRDVNYLDDELSKGPVRYPGSGILSSGNIFVFGHSTGFKIVQNQAYKVFNRIKELKEGDIITIYSLSGKAYNYKVSSVKEVSKNDTWVDFSSKESSLTLSTCDSFGTASDRYVVKAVLFK